ncbi:hypothetical protein CHS0354_035632 [Potamilus streckersoni]|uniref:G-protein coupled receptors family 1 profile domain-containing protein n=2 Tax=Potamilus streckersoni TaxID=2493646 RepID=A0AAE0VHG2_9BIVA|nr:hypothetical protein CHS0354_035632 [Potamilus streckersoni]
MSSLAPAISVTIDENSTFGALNDTASVSAIREGLTLEEINDAIAKTHIGGAVFVGILMLIGFVGNLHVLLIYSFRTKPSNHRIFILCLGVLDMVTCSIGMPFILVDLRYPLMFYATAVCKILRFVNYFMCASSALILLVIAADRYRMICIPLGKQMSQTVAKVSCGIAISIGFAISWPAPILYGYSAEHTGVGNITGVRCWTEERFKKTKYQAYFNFILMFIVFGTFAVLCVLYSMIGAKIFKHKTFKSTVTDSKSVPLSTTGSSKDSSGTKESPMQSTEDAEEELAMDTSKAFNSVEKSSSYKLKFKSNDLPWRSPGKIFKIGGKYKEYYIDKTSGQKEKKKMSKEDTRTRRITFIMFMITLVFFCSFMPHLSLKIVVFMKKDFLETVSPAGLYLYNTFVWSFFVNNMANPIIYGFCDKIFVRELRSFYGRLPCFSR